MRKAAKQILKATHTIINALSHKRFKKLFAQQTYIADIYYEADPDIAKEVYLVGNFSYPEWEVQIPMKYSFFHRAFRTTVKISEGSQFKFLVGDTFVCCPTYPFAYTREKFANNVFETSRSCSRGNADSLQLTGIATILSK